MKIRDDQLTRELPIFDQARISNDEEPDGIHASSASN